jgi:MYXO-CTERM domain-containing protein
MGSRRVVTAITFGSFVVTSVLASAPASAADTTKPIADGVTMITRTTATPNVIHALKADLNAPGVHLGATTSAQRRRQASSYAKLVGAAAATNGDFFSYATYGTSGLAAGGGAPWSDTKDDTSSAALVFDDLQRVELQDGKAVTVFDPTWMKGVVSGHPQVVNAGVELTTNPAASACTTRNPRTSVGLSQDKKTLILMVVDGRSSTSLGMTCTEVAAQMKSFGAYDAINLDGGGSTTMYLRGTGVVNTPSDGIERTVGNHLGIFAPRLGSVGSVHGTVFADPDPKSLLTGATVTIAGGGTDTTDATGLYDLETVPGMFAVTAKKPGFTTKSINVTVATGGDVKLDVGLVADPNADFDGDGVVDSKDDCAEVKNPDQLDTDKDKIGDACDMDDDGDNVADEDDNCPLVANADQADANGDGVGDACPPAAPVAPGGDAGAPIDNPAAPSDSGCSVGRAPGSPTVFFGFALFSAVALFLGMRSRRRR